MPDVILTANGITHGGWLSLKVTSSLAQLSGTFSLGLTERWPGQSDKRGIKPGDSCTLFLGRELIITGWVDSLQADYNADSHQLSVKGRDRTCDLVDCGHSGATVKWQDKTLLQILGEVCQPFGIEIVLDGDQGGVFKEIAYSPGDSVMSLIRKLCRMRGLIPTSLGDGKLLLTGPGATRAGASLVLGENVKSGRISIDHTNRFSIYRVQGQAKPDSQKATYNFFGGQDADTQNESLQLLAAQQSAASPLATATDEEITRHRPLILLAEAPGDQSVMETRAGWEKVNRKGLSRRVTYTVSGWEAKSGELWRINTLVPVRDEYLGIDGELLIETVSYSLDGGSGSICELTLVHPDAYLPEPPELAQAKANKKKQTEIYDFFLRD